MQSFDWPAGFVMMLSASLTCLAMRVVVLCSEMFGSKEVSCNYWSTYDNPLGLPMQCCAFVCLNSERDTTRSFITVYRLAASISLR